jgi:surfactin synthase thioesterase subunit
MDSLPDRLQPEIELLFDLPAAFVGYSVGAIVAYALALKTARLPTPLPRQLLRRSMFLATPECRTRCAIDHVR